MTADEKIRYERQIIIPEIGASGQEKLGAARVMIAGLGGLGSPAAIYLAAAGVGALTVVDSDRVTLSNLNRQILHTTLDAGKLKTESAMDTLNRINPLCRIDAHSRRIRADDAAALAGDCDLIIDATDNIATRQALNRASIEKGIPFIYGGIDGFSGMASTFIPGRTPCLECLFPGSLTTCPPGPIGALGPMAGMIATIQAVEAIKFVIGREVGLAGKLLRVDAINMEWRKLDIDKNPHCRRCAGSPDPANQRHEPP